jgi:hypothetical protein
MSEKCNDAAKKRYMPLTNTSGAQPTTGIAVKLRAESSMLLLISILVLGTLKSLRLIGNSPEMA